ncbi:conserved hypothetical protein [Trichophyton verrucosum HKI 0517]|uniref:AHC1-like C2H2 zinc-finger domain-containing protein n=1 Tax=Trichophyton verrucosum (strain HKI 0517) TaxID=663202 RepID=D4DBV5_TRIVH|nr:uncharacterized protein TRV_04606 [Trichophyton verrucosum HKI 0517]EFE40675.1 conserved hypothetical protein [Trichophyton verrucosum HKI 0517]
MFRLLPWSSIARVKQVTGTAQEHPVKEMAVREQNPSSSQLQSQSQSQTLKRKRSDSAGSEVISQDAAGYSKIAALHRPTVSADNDSIAQSRDVAEPRIGPDRDPVTKPTSKANIPKLHDLRQPIAARTMDTEELRQTLESQFSLEVLLKHDELRMIEQEMAKCQVALEQLRRCGEIPYPGSGLTGPLAAVSNGSGPAVMPPRSSPRPPASPSPWGTNDGAYTRHYARWLLPDPRFDGGEVETVPLPSRAGKSPVVDGRTTRASWADATTASSRSHRGTAGAKLQALSSGYPPPKDKAGPMIIKRKTDGQFVKLVCLDCRRDNFSSTQGFINHCRIAHNRSFASHDAAAAASGEPVEVDEAGTVVGGQSEPPAAGPAGYVHPLIRSALLTDPAKGAKHSNQQAKASTNPPIQSVTPSPQLQPKSSTPRGGPKKPDVSPASTFKASPQTPHLSSLMLWKGIDIDLSHVVNDALTKPDVDMFLSDENSDSEVDENTSHGHTSSQLSIRNNRLPGRTVYASSQPQRPGSRKGMDKRGAPTRRSPGLLHTSTSPTLYSSGMAAGRHPEPDGDMDMTGSNSPNLSPNTVESNQAPSLVSDDGEYEAPSESESPSPSSSGSEDEGNTFDDVKVQDGDDPSADSNASNSTTGHISGPAKHHARPPIPTTPTRRHTVGRKDELKTKNAKRHR